MTVDIPNRDEQHGGMEAVGALSQNLKSCLRRSNGWSKLDSGEREALDMICHMLARILSGSNPHDPASWHEIAGYAVAARRADQPTTSNTP
jgi:hypothetical protein